MGDAFHDYTRSISISSFSGIYFILDNKEKYSKKTSLMNKGIVNFLIGSRNADFKLHKEATVNKKRESPFEFEGALLTKYMINAFSSPLPLLHRS